MMPLLLLPILILPLRAVDDVTNRRMSLLPISLRSCWWCCRIAPIFTLAAFALPMQTAGRERGSDQEPSGNSDHPESGDCQQHPLQRQGTTSLSASQYRMLVGQLRHQNCSSIFRLISDKRNCESIMSVRQLSYMLFQFSDFSTKRNCESMSVRQLSNILFQFSDFSTERSCKSMSVRVRQLRYQYSSSIFRHQR